MNTPKTTMKTLQSLLLPLLACAVLASLFGCVTTGTSTQSAPPVPPEATTDNERIGDMFLQSNKLDDALMQYDMAQEAGASRASVAFRKGFVYLAKSKWQEALDWFTVAIGNDPTMTLAYEGAGKATLEMGYLRNAAAFFQGAVQHSPDYWVPYIYLSAVYDVVGRTQEAREYAEKARSLVDENDTSVYMTLAVAQKRAEFARDMYPELSSEWIEALAAEDAAGPQASYEPAPSQETAASAMDAGGEPTEADLAAEEPAEDESGQNALDEAVEAARQEAGASEEPSVGDQELPAVEPSMQEAEAQAEADTAQAQDVAAQETQAEEPPVEVAQAEEAPAEAAPAEEPAQHIAVSSADEEPNPAEAAPEPASEEPEHQEPAQAAAETSTPAEPEPTVAHETTAEEAMPAPEGQEVASLNPSGYNYSILESSWRTEEEARVRVSTLGDMGITANIVPVNLPEKGLWYRVMIGDFAELSAAERIKGQLIGESGLSHLNILRDGRFFQPVD